MKELSIKGKGIKSLHPAFRNPTQPVQELAVQVTLKPGKFSPSKENQWPSPPKPATSFVHSGVTITLPGFGQLELKGHDLAPPAQAFVLPKALGTSAAPDSTAQ